MLNLLPAIDELQKRKKHIEGLYQTELDGVNRALEILIQMNEACPSCGGHGKKLRGRSCAEDDRPDPNDPADWVKCSVCGGTGRSPIQNNQPTKEGGEQIGDFIFR